MCICTVDKQGRFCHFLKICFVLYVMKVSNYIAINIQLLLVDWKSERGYQLSTTGVEVQRVYDKVENGFWCQKRDLGKHKSKAFFSFFFFCSVKTDLLKDGAISRLYIAFASKRDTGNYTCSMRNAQASVFVHILDGMYYFNITKPLKPQTPKNLCNDIITRTEF